MFRDTRGKIGKKKSFVKHLSPASVAFVAPWSVCIQKSMTLQERRHLRLIPRVRKLVVPFTKFGEERDSPFMDCYTYCCDNPQCTGWYHPPEPSTNGGFEQCSMSSLDSKTLQFVDHWRASQMTSRPAAGESPPYKHL